MRSNFLTSSRLAKARACARLEYFTYEAGYRSRAENKNLRFGTLLHLALEAWWSEPNPANRMLAAYTALNNATIEDPYERVKLEVLMAGYDARWGLQLIRALDHGGRPAVEIEFVTDLVNPDTNGKSRTWKVRGKLDGVGEDLAEAYQVPEVIEHKSSASDIGPGSDYRARLAMDSQVSIYFDGASALGYRVGAVVYDVIGKPTMRPSKATPVAERKYTEKPSKLKDGTVRPAGSLYANQREEDETPEEYGARLADDIATDPNEYYQRVKVVRLKDELREARFDVWMTAERMREFYKAKYWPRNPDACWSYGSLCPFFGVCTKTQHLEDETLFEKVDNVHPELSDGSAPVSQAEGG